MIADVQAIRGKRVLILEDDYYLATDLQAAVEAAGATVIGPFGDEADAAAAIEEALPDCAFLDVDLGYGPTFDVARALASRDVPFAFVTGYNSDIIEEAFASATRFEKPVEVRRVAATITDMLAKN